MSASGELSFADKEAQLLTALRQVIDPDLGRDIVTLGFVKNIAFEPLPDAGGDEARFDCELTTPACPVKDKFREECTRLAEALPFVARARVNLTAQPPSSQAAAAASAHGGAGDALRDIASIVLVASAKGGVGKSTTAVNLAFTLARTGARVGILDADIYGPSLPIMVEPQAPYDAPQFKPNNRIEPLRRDGVKLMSFGYVNPDPAMMRGPMVGSVLTQLAQQTDWGELDFLVVDMPPGTGDVQITLGQILRADAAVVVTTPQRLAFADVVKGIQLLDKLGVPPVAVVENMAYFEAPDTGVRYSIFGRGHRARLAHQFGIANTFEMPLFPAVNEAGDTGAPVTAASDDDHDRNDADEDGRSGSGEVLRAYKRLADAVVREVARVKFGGLKVPEAAFDQATGDIVVSVENEQVHRVWPATLRRQCRCAQCVDELSGAQLLRADAVPDDVQPLRMMNVGNYALAVNWSDGHQSIMPWERFVPAFAERAQVRRQHHERMSRGEEGDDADGRSATAAADERAARR